MWVEHILFLIELQNSLVVLFFFLDTGTEWGFDLPAFL